MATSLEDQLPAALEKNDSESLSDCVDRLDELRAVLVTADIGASPQLRDDLLNLQMALAINSSHELSSDVVDTIDDMVAALHFLADNAMQIITVLEGVVAARRSTATKLV